MALLATRVFPFVTLKRGLSLVLEGHLHGLATNLGADHHSGSSGKDTAGNYCLVLIVVLRGSPNLRDLMLARRQLLWWLQSSPPTNLFCRPLGSPEDAAALPRILVRQLEALWLFFSLSPFKQFLLGQAMVNWHQEQKVSKCNPHAVPFMPWRVSERMKQGSNSSNPVEWKPTQGSSKKWMLPGSVF